MTFEEELAKAVRTLSRRDPLMRPIIRRHGAPTFRPHDDYFATLVDAIISQQISGRAADSIMRKLRDAVGNALAPEAIASVADDALRTAGISPQKLGYLRSLCGYVLDDGLDLAALPSQSNEEIIKELTAVKGIGLWTAQMFLMFCLGRLDVLPTGDLGIQRGVQILYGMTELAKPRQIEELADRNRWAPYRSVASWYLWRATE